MVGRSYRARSLKLPLLYLGQKTDSLDTGGPPSAETHVVGSVV